MFEVTLDQMTFGLGLAILVLAVLDINDIKTTVHIDRIRQLIRGQGINNNNGAMSTGALTFILVAFAMIIRGSRVAEADKRLAKTWLLMSIFVSLIFYGFTTNNETELRVSWVFSNFAMAAGFILPLFLVDIKA